MNSSPANQPEIPFPQASIHAKSPAPKSTVAKSRSATSARGRFLGPATTFTPLPKGEALTPASIQSPSPLFQARAVTELRTEQTRIHERIDVTVTAVATAPERDLWREHLEHAHVPVAVTAPGQGWLYYNQALCDLLGYPESELRSLNWMALTHPEDQAADSSAFSKLLSGELEVIRHPKRLRARDGRDVPVIVTVTPKRRSDGVIDRLYHTVLERSRRSPAETDYSSSSPIRRLADLENRILHRFQKPEQAVMDLGLWGEWEAVEPLSILRGLQDQVQEWTRAHRLEWLVSPKLPRVHGNTSQLRRAFENVLWNAIEAVEGRSNANVTISCAQHWLEGDMVDASLMGYQPMSGDYLAFEVRDQGPGMDAQVQQHLFDPQFTRKKDHVGLGATVLLEVVRRHQGVVRISSIPGRGSCVRVFLPVHTGHLGEITDKGSSKHPGAGTILLVDDEEGVRSILCTMMETMGCSVKPVGDSAAALEVFASDPFRFSAVLMDWSMPGLGGSELIAQLRRIRPGMPVILMSGYMEGEIQGMGEPQADIFLQKPFTRDCLEAALKSVSPPRTNA